jgi:hypothetical protein
MRRACQEGRRPGGFECVPALGGVNVVRPVGRSTLTPRAGRRGGAPVRAAGRCGPHTGGGRVADTGPGSGWSEVPVTGGRPAALDNRSRPGVPSRARLLGLSVGGQLPAGVRGRRADPTDGRRRPGRGVGRLPGADFTATLGQRWLHPSSTGPTSTTSGWPGSSAGSRRRRPTCSRWRGTSGAPSVPDCRGRKHDASST